MPADASAPTAEVTYLDAVGQALMAAVSEPDPSANLDHDGEARHAG